MNRLTEIIERLQDLATLRGSDCKTIVKLDGKEYQIDGIRSDTSTGQSIVIITVVE